MSDTINTIVDKKAYEQVKQLADELKNSRLELVELLKVAQGGGISFKNIQVPSDLDKKIKKNRNETEQLSASLKEQDRLEKALISSLAKKEAAQEGTNKALIKARAETQAINKEQKRQAILSSDLTGEYKKQSTILNTLRDRYKDMVLEQKGGTTEARKMKREIDELDSKLKAVDASVGQHQRNVGNYSSALGNLSPGLERINMGLEGMGTNLNDLSASKNPFKDLTAAVVNFGKATMAFLLSPIGLAITAIGALFMLINRNKDTVMQFDSGLRDVGKTTGLAGEELEGLGDDIVTLSRRLKTVGTPALLEYATVAGQLGVKGRQNILAFAEGLAKLETASDISGEEGASKIARLLTLTDGGVENIKAFGDEIVVLGNNFAATENEILSNATAIAQNTGVYKFGRQEVLAYATATKAVGVEAELTGSTIGRTLGQMEKALRTGNNIQTLANLTGKSVEDLRAQFENDSAGVFREFVKGLNDIDKAGGSVNEQLEQIGITSVRDQRVLGSLATGGFDVLQGAIEKVTKATGELDKEFLAASQKLTKQSERFGIAWDNLVLSIENGQGIFGKTFAWLAGTGAGYLEILTVTINMLSAAWGGMTSVLSEIKGQFMDLFSLIGKSAHILMNPVKAMKDMGAGGFKAFFNEIKTEFANNGKNIGEAWREGFLGTMQKIDAENKLKEKLKELQDPSSEDELPDVPEGLQATEGSIAAIQASITALQEQRDNFATSAKDVREYNEAISKLQEELDKLNGKVRATETSMNPLGTMDIETPGISAPTDTFELERKVFENNEKSKTEFLKKQEEERREAVRETFAQFSDVYGIDFDAFENLIIKKGELTKGDYVDAAASAANTILNMTKQRYDEELRYAAETRDAILNNDRASEEQKRIAEEEYREKEKEIRRKQAEDEKRATLFQIAINTAAAVVKALPNVPLSILAGSLGAAQAAFVASQPVPRFKDGHLLGTYEGPAIINDAPGSNYKEILERKDGTIEAPSGRNVLVGMNRGDKVHKNYDSFLKTRDYDDVIQASILTSILSQQERISSAELGNAFDHHLMQQAIDQGIKEGFRNVSMNTTVKNDNAALLRELRTQRRRDV